MNISNRLERCLADNKIPNCPRNQCYKNQGDMIIIQYYFRLSICNKYQLLLTYCYINNNLINLAVVCSFKLIFVVKYKILKCGISGQIFKMAGYPAQPYFERCTTYGHTYPSFEEYLFLYLYFLTRWVTRRRVIMSFYFL